jgi:hypothetical protein
MSEERVLKERDTFERVGLASTITSLKREFEHFCATPNCLFSFPCEKMAHTYKAFSQVLADGRKVTSLNVLAICKELTIKGVDAASFPLLKKDKMALLMSVLSKERSQNGPLGQLEDGTDIASMSEDETKTELAKRKGDPNHSGDKQLELRRIVRITTAAPVTLK